MKLLIIYDLPRVANLRRQLLNQSFFYPKYRPDTELVLHNVGDLPSKSLVNADYDAIFLDVSLLCWRWATPRSAFESLLKTYDWVARHRAPKIAFPQDDYDHQAILDEWLFAWNVDVVCTPLAPFKDVLYPKTATKASIVAFQTGFIDDVDLQISAQFNSSFADRPVDVVYRARPLPANFGRLGQLKTLIAEKLEPKLAGAGFRTDISTDPEATIFGRNWLDFLAGSRFVLGTPSGSSVVDPQGEIGRSVVAYAAAHPGAGFDEIHAQCVPDAAEHHWMSAISPRVLEAALTRTCQVLVRGEYGPLQPNEHYIPLEPDFSNVDEVIERMGDLTEAQHTADRCYQLVTGDESLSYRHAADILDDAIHQIYLARGEARPISPQPVRIEQVIERHILARIGERQRLLADLTEKLGEETTGAPIAVARFSELISVLADRWGRVQAAFKEASQQSASREAIISQHETEVKSLSAEAFARDDVIAQREVEIKDLLAQIATAKKEIAELERIHANYETLLADPKALLVKLYAVLKNIAIPPGKQRG